MKQKQYSFDRGYNILLESNLKYDQHLLNLQKIYHSKDNNPETHPWALKPDTPSSRSSKPRFNAKLALAEESIN